MNNKGLSKLAYFRFAPLGERVLLTNDIGEYAFVTSNQLDLLLEDRLENSAPQKFLELTQKNFLLKNINLPLMVNRYATKYFVGKGTDLHIVVLTLRCDHKCLYCHASAVSINNLEYDMDLATAGKVVDRIFESSSGKIMIEFQGGEPLLNFKVLQYIVKTARKKNLKEKKALTFSLVSNLAFMDKEKMDFLTRNRVQICSSLDGPAKVHNAQRKRPGNDSHQRTVSWLKKLIKESSRIKGAPKPGALVTVTRSSLSYPRQIIDEYHSLGIDNIHLRWINPFGMSLGSWEKLHYSAEQFLSFYCKALDYILELNKKGLVFAERGAVIFLQKIFFPKDPNYLDLRSPCGAGIGQMAYNYNGDVYTCDEGRMLSRMGDESFRIGSVFKQSRQDYLKHPAVQIACTASCLEVIPGCSQCVYKPYCGICPVYNYSQQGDAFKNAEFTCKIKKGILEYLFKKMENPENLNVFRGWLGIEGRAQ